MEKRKRGRPRKSDASNLEGIGKPIDESKSYIVGRLTKNTQNSPNHPNFVGGTRQKFYGRELTKQGINNTGTFWEQNPLDLRTTNRYEWWYLFQESDDGVDLYYDKGQFARQGTPREQKPKEDQAQQSLVMPKNATLQDQIMGTLMNNALSGSRNAQNNEIVQLYMRKMEQDNEQLRSLIVQLQSDVARLSEQNKAHEISAGQFKVIKDAEIATAIARAKAEQEKEDEAMYKELIEQEKQNKKGLGDMLQDPAVIQNVSNIAGMLMQAPQMLRDLMAVYREAQGQGAAPQSQQQYAYDEHGNPVPTVPTTMALPSMALPSRNGVA